jgi:hypothetical protein
MTARPAKTGKKQDARFAKGRSGNPKGRPQGSRNRVTVMLEAIMEDKAEAILETVIQKAEEGDLAAAKLILDRVCPPRKDRPVTVDLPAIRGTKDLVTAMSKVIEVAAKGEITPSEAQALSGLIETKRRVTETGELERRVAALESEKEGKRP